MKQSRRAREIEARRLADPIAAAAGREDIDYSTDELPTAPRAPIKIQGVEVPKEDYCPTCGALRTPVK